MNPQTTILREPYSQIFFHYYWSELNESFWTHASRKVARVTVVFFFRFLHRKRVTHKRKNEKKWGPRKIDQRTDGSTYSVDIHINRRGTVCSI